MTESSIQNPYSPPTVVGGSLPPPAAASKRWIWWVCGTVVAETLVTLFVILGASFFTFGVPQGIVAVAISGSPLVAACVLVGRRHHLRFALVLTQVMNLVMWLTMLVSFLILPPIFGDSTSLTSNDYRVLAMLWLGGAAVALIIVFLLNQLRRAGAESQPASFALLSAESGDAHEQ